MGTKRLNEQDDRPRATGPLKQGTGKLKGQTFRLSNMGDETPATINELLAALDDSLPA